MNKYCIFFILVCILSCKSQPGSDRNNDKFDPSKTFKLQLNPTVGSIYNYDITNETEIEVEVNDQKINNDVKTDMGITFHVNKDSTGNFLLAMSYDKIHLHTKSGDKETEADAINASSSINPLEKILGLIKDANLVATISPSGITQSISGYKELGDKIIAGFDPNDVTGKTIAQNQWQKKIGDGLVKNSVEQLFKIFPDSSVHVRDSWRLTSKQEGEIGLTAKSTYTLKAINNDIAVLSSEGVITSDNSSADILGMNGVNLDLKGNQEGEFEIETKTGMVINCQMKAHVEGTIHVMGRDVPVTIKTSVKMKGHKS